MIRIFLIKKKILSLVFGCRLGQVDNAGKHFFYVEEPSDPMVVKVLEEVDRHLNKCADARRRGEWNTVLTEVSAAMESGADMSPQVSSCIIIYLLKNQNQKFFFVLNMLKKKSAASHV